MPRLSVNITAATESALRQVAEREKVTLTEALRRLVGYGDLVYRTVRIDGDELLRRRRHRQERIILTDVDGSR